LAAPLTRRPRNALPANVIPPDYNVFSKTCCIQHISITQFSALARAVQQLQGPDRRRARWDDSSWGGTETPMSDEKWCENGCPSYMSAWDDLGRNAS
jgi:hypothetical protein